jgi:hypothetical protein
MKTIRSSELSDLAEVHGVKTLKTVLFIVRAMII